jgi:hypothetical protein
MPKHLQNNTPLTPSDVSGTLPVINVNKINGRTLDTSGIGGAGTNRAVTFINATNTLQFRDGATPSQFVTIASSTASTQMSGTILTNVLSLQVPSAGVYFVEFSTSCEISRRGAAAWYSIHDNLDTINLDSERVIDNSNTNTSNNMLRWSVYTMGIITATAANDFIYVKVRSSGNNNTVTTYDRVLTALRLS